MGRPRLESQGCPLHVPAWVPAQKPLSALPPPFVPPDQTPLPFPGAILLPTRSGGGSCPLFSGSRRGTGGGVGGGGGTLELSLPLPPTLRQKLLLLCAGQGEGGGRAWRRGFLPFAPAAAPAYFSFSRRLLAAALPGVAARSPSRWGPSPGAAVREDAGGIKDSEARDPRRRRRPRWGVAAGRLAEGDPGCFPPGRSSARAALSNEWFCHFEPSRPPNPPLPGCFRSGIESDLSHRRTWPPLPAPCGSSSSGSQPSSRLPPPAGPLPYDPLPVTCPQTPPNPGRLLCHCDTCPSAPGATSPPPPTAGCKDSSFGDSHPVLRP